MLQKNTQTEYYLSCFLLNFLYIFYYCALLENYCEGHCECVLYACGDRSRNNSPCECHVADSGLMRCYLVAVDSTLMSETEPSAVFS